VDFSNSTPPVLFEFVEDHGITLDEVAPLSGPPVGQTLVSITVHGIQEDEVCYCEFTTSWMEPILQPATLLGQLNSGPHSYQQSSTFGCLSPALPWSLQQLASIEAANFCLLVVQPHQTAGYYLRLYSLATDPSQTPLQFVYTLPRTSVRAISPQLVHFSIHNTTTMETAIALVGTDFVNSTWQG
jgi:hypothetical protein